MPWATLKKIFFCCQESDEILDESSHLIIPTESESVISPYSDVVVPDHRQLRERMALIVRTKAGKMVNVASETPFNLRNPSEPSYGSPLSIYGSLDQHPRDHDYPIDYSGSNRGIVRQERFYTSTFGDRSGSSSRSSGPIAGPSYPRYHSRTLDHPVPTPIFNVRLVRNTDTMTKARGRTRDRLSTDKSNPTNGATRVEHAEAVVTTGSPETSCEGLSAASTFQPRDVRSVTINWND